MGQKKASERARARGDVPASERGEHHAPESPFGLVGDVERVSEVSETTSVVDVIDVIDMNHLASLSSLGSEPADSERAPKPSQPVSQPAESNSLNIVGLEHQQPATATNSNSHPRHGFCSGRWPV